MDNIDHIHVKRPSKSKNVIFNKLAKRKYGVKVAAQMAKESRHKRIGKEARAKIRRPKYERESERLIEEYFESANEPRDPKIEEEEWNRMVWEDLRLSHELEMAWEADYYRDDLESSWETDHYHECYHEWYGLYCY